MWVCDHDGILRLVAPEKFFSLRTFGFCDLNVKVFLTSPPSFCTILSWNKSQVDFQLRIFIQMGCEMERSLRAIFGSSRSHNRASFPWTLSSQLWNWIISLETTFQAPNPYILRHFSSIWFTTKSGLCKFHEERWYSLAFKLFNWMSKTAEARQTMPRKAAECLIARLCKSFGCCWVSILGTIMLNTWNFFCNLRCCWVIL